MEFSRLFALTVAVLSCTLGKFVYTAVTLDPQAVYACPGEKLELTCTASHAATLQWIISVPDETSRSGVISSVQAVSVISVDINSNVFILARTFIAPLRSTLTATATSSLNGTIIQCSTGGDSVRMASITTIDIGFTNPHPLYIKSLLLGNNTAFVHISWMENLNRGNIFYSLDINPPVQESLLADANILLYVLYNVEYNVTLNAQNCEGRGAASIQLLYGKCSYPDVSEDVILTQYKYPALSGTAVNFTCSPGKVIVGSNSSICNISGYWNPDLTRIRCIVDCGTPDGEDIDSARLFYSATTEGSTVVYECNDGFLNNSVNQSSVCHSNGSWAPQVYCRQRSKSVCNSPLPPNNGAITEMKVTDEGVNVTYRCNDGFTPTGDITALCNANGTWNNNPVDTVCTAVTKDNVALQITVSSVVSGIVCFACGIFLGVILSYIKWCINGKIMYGNVNNSSYGARNDPMYEEVDYVSRKRHNLQLNDNVSYASRRMSV